MEKHNSIFNKVASSAPNRETRDEVLQVHSLTSSTSKPSSRPSTTPQGATTNGSSTSQPTGQSNNHTNHAANSTPSSSDSSSSSASSSESGSSGTSGVSVSSGEDSDEGDSRGLLEKVALDKPSEALGLPFLTSNDQQKAILVADQAFYMGNGKGHGSRTHLDVSHRSDRKHERSLMHIMTSNRYSTTSSSSQTGSDNADCGATPYNYPYRRQSMATKFHQSVTKKLKKSPSKKLTLFALSLVNLTAYLTMSIIAPFFPFEAAQKGMSPTLSGFVFSVYALVMMIASPLLGMTHLI